MGYCVDAFDAAFSVWDEASHRRWEGNMGGWLVRALTHRDVFIPVIRAESHGSV